jgi:hypothetical protein
VVSFPYRRTLHHHPSRTAAVRVWVAARLKHDDHQLIARLDGACVRLLTRSGNDFSTRYPAAEKAIAALQY